MAGAWSITRRRIAGQLKPVPNEQEEEYIFDILTENGYAIADTKDEIMRVDSAGKTYAHPALHALRRCRFLWTQRKAPDAADFVRKEIDALDNKKDFLWSANPLIDWACHANDAMTAISETLCTGGRGG
jgi:alkaline phosphatase